jgi:hypothetical protein
MKKKCQGIGGCVLFAPRRIMEDLCSISGLFIIATGLAVGGHRWMRSFRFASLGESFLQHINVITLSTGLDPEPSVDGFLGWVM